MGQADLCQILDPSQYLDIGLFVGQSPPLRFLHCLMLVHLGALALPLLSFYNIFARLLRLLFVNYNAISKPRESA